MASNYINTHILNIKINLKSYDLFVLLLLKSKLFVCSDMTDDNDSVNDIYYMVFRFEIKQRVYLFYNKKKKKNVRNDFFES